MRRIISICLAAAMLFAALPVVYASENSSDAHDELIELACQTFPEYEGNIRSAEESLPMRARTSSPAVLVCSDSREISDGQTLHYSEYSNGIILLTEYTPQRSVTEVDHNTGAGATAYTINIRATCTGINGTFHANNIKFTTISSAYDRIDSVGTYEMTNVTGSGYTTITLTGSSAQPFVVYNESASGKATLYYNLTFRYGAAGRYVLATQLTLSVGQDGYMVTHVEL